MIKKRVLTLAMSSLLALSLAACGNNNGNKNASNAGEASSASAANQVAETKVETIKIAVVNADKPKSYVDDNGKVTGYDVEALRKVDELLPQYEFEIEAMDYEAMLVGIESGKYQIGSDSLLKTPAREEKFLFPSENLGITLVKLVTTVERADINSLDDVVNTGAKLVPIPANFGTYAVLTAYNDANPNNPLKLEAIEALDRADAYRWLVDGRYDAFVTTADGHPKTAEALGFMDKLRLSDVVSTFSTYSIFNKEATQLADDVSGALKELKNNGELSKLAVEFLGEDVLQYDNK